jgi:cysteine synthase A
VLLGGPPGPHKIEGIGIGYTPPLWDRTVVDEIVPIKTEEAKDMTRRLAREEGLFAGTSSGANVIAAIQLAQRLGPGSTVVTRGSSISAPTCIEGARRLPSRPCAAGEMQASAG